MWIPRHAYRGQRTTWGIQASLSALLKQALSFLSHYITQLSWAGCMWGNSPVSTLHLTLEVLALYPHSLYYLQFMSMGSWIIVTL